jgi:phosphatidylglycerol:prolipoprotein diacylglycerol transferase
VLLAAGGVALAVAVYSFVTKSRSGVLGSVGALVALGVAALQLKDQTVNIGPTPIYSYGVMLGLSLVVGWYLTLGLAERDGLPKDTMANNYVVTALAAIVGARLLYVVTNLDEFDSIASIFAMRRGGLVAYGGFLGGFVGSYVFLRRHGISLLPWADVAVPSLASGLMITRIGCYLFGCDFGQPLKPSAPSWLQKLGSFPHWAEGTLQAGSGSPAWVQHVKERGLSPDAASSLPVHPTQLYESLIGLGLLVLLLSARKTQKFRGQIFLLFTFAYGVCRFSLELLRDDNERGSIPPSLAEHVLIPLCFALFAVGFVAGFSRLIKHLAVRRVAQVLAFVPAVVAFAKLRPESFAGSMTIELSTSQFVALASGLAASVAFAVLYKAALLDPARAMALNLPPELALAGRGAGAPRTPVDDDDEDDGGDEKDEATSSPKRDED